MRSLSRKTAAFLLGLLAAALLLEFSLRIVGISGLMPGARLPMNAVHEPDAGALRVLCLGNSHTEGAAETLEGAYPAQLEKLLLAQGRKAQVINAGRGNWNSSEILDYLPGYLRKYKPAVVFLMAGEPNAWNYRFFYKQENRFAWLLDVLRSLKSVRLLDLLLRFRPEGERESTIQNAFLDLPWFEYPTLAMSWVRRLEAHPAIANVTAGDREVAVEALRRWTGSELGKDRQLALALLVELEFFSGRKQQAMRAATQLLALPWKPFDLRLRRSLEKSGAVELLRELNARAPAPEVVALAEKILAGGDVPISENSVLLAGLADILPGNLRVYRALAKAYRKEGKPEKIKEVYQRVQRENPLGEGMRELLESMREVSQQDRISIGRSTLVPMFTTYQNGNGLGEGQRLPVGSQMSQEQIEAEFSRVQRWALSDLRRIVELARDSGAKVVVQTYPLYRKSGLERWPDPLLRSVAKEEGVALSDTSIFFREFLKGKDREEFYFKAGRAFQDDHLNAKGNALVARLMVEKLRELGQLK